MARGHGDDDDTARGATASGATAVPTVSADGPPSPASTGIVLLQYVPTTVAGVLLVLGGTRGFLQHLAARVQTFDGFATPVVLITLGTGLLVASLGAASVRALRAA